MTDPVKDYETIWREWKGTYDTFFSDRNRFKCCIDLVLKSRPGVVLDMGCGPGYFAYLLKQNNPKIIVHGLDISKTALDKASYLDKKFELDIDKRDVPQQDESYDVVVCTQFLEHIYDVRHALTEMCRLLKKGGIGVISVPNCVFWRFRIYFLLGRIPEWILNEQHIRFFNIALLKRKVEEAGLKVIKILGSRRRYPFLCSISKSLFSEWLIFEFVKK